MKRVNYNPSILRTALLFLTIVMGIFFLSSMGSHAFAGVSSKSDVKSITFEQKQALSLVEDMDCQYIDGDFYYYWPSFQPGDRLTVTLKDNSKKTYECKQDEDWPYFVNVDNPKDTLGTMTKRSAQWADGDESDTVYFGTGQNGEWGVGSHTCYVLFCGKRTSVNVNIVENPIDSINFIPVRPYTYVENTNQTDCPSYSGVEYAIPRFNNGDKLVVNGKNGEKATYVYQVSQFVNEKDNTDVIDSSYGFNESNRCAYMISTDQTEEHQWGIGEHFFTLWYGGKSCKVSVQIVRDNLKAIRYNNGQTRDIVRGFDKHSHGSMPGDILTLVDKNGNEKNYIYEDDEYWNGTWWSSYGVYVAEDGTEISGGNVDISFDSADGIHTVKYAGLETSFPVRFIDNPVRSISYDQTKPFVLKKDVDIVEWDADIYKYMVYFQIGDKVTLHYKDGTSKTYEYRKVKTLRGVERKRFVNVQDSTDTLKGYSEDYADNINSSDELNLLVEDSKNWKVGEHTVYVVYCDVRTPVKVTLKDNNNQNKNPNHNNTNNKTTVPASERPSGISRTATLGNSQQGSAQFTKPDNKVWYMTLPKTSSKVKLKKVKTKKINAGTRKGNTTISMKYKVKLQKKHKMEGIVVWVSPSKSFKTSVRGFIKTGSRSVMPNVMLQKNKTYYVKTQVITTKGGHEYHSGWSKVKKIKGR